MNQNNSQPQSNQRNENILCAVLALLKELDESSLELVRRDIDRKLGNKFLLFAPLIVLTSFQAP